MHVLHTQVPGFINASIHYTYTMTLQVSIKYLMGVSVSANYLAAPGALVQQPVMPLPRHQLVPPSTTTLGVQACRLLRLLDGILQIFFSAMLCRAVHVTVLFKM